MKEKNELRPPFQVTLSLRRSAFSENGHVEILGILTNICKQQGKEQGNKACLKAVELMEAGATEEEVIQAMQDILNFT